MSKDTPRKIEIHIKMTKIIQDYNYYMVGVNMLDKDVSLYYIIFKYKKWWWPTFTQILDVTVMNTWRIYQTLKCGIQSVITGCTEEDSCSIFKEKTHLNAQFPKAAYRRMSESALI
jgi:hypothetical protein